MNGFKAGTRYECAIIFFKSFLFCYLGKVYTQLILFVNMCIFTILQFLGSIIVILSNLDIKKKKWQNNPLLLNTILADTCAV